MNVILFVCDTLRADHLGCYGYFRDTSPNIDKIAEQGVLYEDYYNAGVPTGPGFTSIITGLYPIHHKYYAFNDPNVRQVDDRIIPLAEVMQAMGYTTVAIDTLMNMGGKGRHWVRGYEYYINATKRPFVLPCAVLAEKNNEKLFEWLDNHLKEKFFIFVHYWDPHTPYNPPREYGSKFGHEKGSLKGLMVKEASAGYKYVPGWGEIKQIPEIEDTYASRRLSVDVYDGEIAYMDNELGKVINYLGEREILDETLILLTSDHGEQLGQHNNTWMHGGLHASVTHIPLLMRGSERFSKGNRIKGLCQQIDIMPTILDLLDVSRDIISTLELDGLSILPLNRGKEIRNPIFIESGGARAIRNNDWLLIDHSSVRRDRMHRETELYKVKSDPMEIINLAKTNENETEKLMEILRSWVKTNIKEGEQDPAIYGKHTYEGVDSRKAALEYRAKTKKLREDLRKR